MRYYALLLAVSLGATGAQVTCTGTVTESAVSLSCSPSGAPSQPCNPSASPSTFQSSSNATTVTFTASCPGQWSNAPNAPPVTNGQTVFGPGTPAGTYTYSINGAAVNVTVTPAQSVSCNLTGEFQYAGQFKDFTLSPGGVATFRLPPVTQTGKNAELTAVSTVNTPGLLLSEIAISDTCGSFDVEPLCKTTGSSFAMSIHAFTPPSGGYCTLTPGRTYYVNVRNRVNGVESCASNCEQRLGYNGNLR
jgi:hypothetical protein